MYFITTVGKDDTRCVGYYTSIGDAVGCVVRNSCDINEAGCYPYAVIEYIDEGLYQYDTNPQWYKYNEKLNRYEPSNRPDFVGDNEVGYAIG